MELLVLLFFFHLILDINSQNVPQPRLLMSPEVITERGSVKLHCYVPRSVKVHQCYFYPEGENTNTKLSPSCQLSLTGSELIRWTRRRSPGTLHIICYYTVDYSVKTPSPHSLRAPVTVLNQKPKLSISHDDQFDEFTLSCEIPGSESVTADFSCNLYTGENPQPWQHQRSQKTRSGKVLCIFKAQRNEVLNRLQSVKQREVSCDYSLTSDPTARSLMSDKYSLIPFLPTPTQPSVTTEKSTAYVPQPRLLVSPEVITERGSVKLRCDVPHSVKVSQCNFYPEGDYRKLKHSPSCQLSLTGSELIRWTRRRSPGTLHIICFYSVDYSDRTPSPHSLPAPVTVLNQKPILNISHDHQLDEFRFECEIPGSESVTANFSCNLYTGEIPQPYVKIFFQKRESGKVLCIFKALGDDLSRRLQSVKRREVSCDYSLTSDPTARSLMSDKYSLIRFFPTPTQPSVTTEKSTAYFLTETTQLLTTEKSTSDLSLVTTPTSVSAASSVLSTHLKTTRHTTTNLSSLSPISSTTKEKTTSELSTVSLSQTTTKEKSTAAFPVSDSHVNTTRGPKTSEKPNTTDQTDFPKRKVFVLLLSATGVCVLLAGMMSVCLCRFIRKRMAERREMDKTRGDKGMISMLNMNTSDSEAVGTYSVISSVPLPSLPLETSGEIKEDSKKSEDDVYHTYCTIADTQVVAKDKDATYCLLQMH
ncbi:uncharacterized protein LOC128316994 isoform X2 [Pangasianodon hypophthalmus]|uniref:uncharacterized protein LOC128316994 isoform X2 n=1 Tax=Pangasianodon hypophthalmus TaxID=310915 RepID=UPI0023079F7F|nr:uncharacterized protein LOC128316994 isoform X2 [Pangasianodon hypophthalmus]